MVEVFAEDIKDFFSMSKRVLSSLNAFSLFIVFVLMFVVWVNVLLKVKC